MNAVLERESSWRGGTECCGRLRHRHSGILRLMVLLLSQTYRRPTVDLSSVRVCGAACESAWRACEAGPSAPGRRSPSDHDRQTIPQQHSARRAIPRRFRATQQLSVRPLKLGGVKFVQPHLPPMAEHEKVRPTEDSPWWKGKGEEGKQIAAATRWGLMQIKERENPDAKAFWKSLGFGRDYGETSSGDFKQPSRPPGDGDC